MVRRYELIYDEWKFTRSLLPGRAGGAADWTIAGSSAGAWGRFVPGWPEWCRSWATLHTRFRRCATDGTFTRMLQAAQAKLDAVGDIGWLVSVDSTIVRAHQHAAGPKKGTPRTRTRAVPGGLTSKIHLDCDAADRPLALVVIGGNTNDCTRFTTVMEPIQVPRIGPDRPRTRPDRVIGDQEYSSKAIRTWLRRRDIAHTIPGRADQVRNRARRGSCGGRSPVFGPDVYKRRNVVSAASTGSSSGAASLPATTGPPSPARWPSPSPHC